MPQLNSTKLHSRLSKHDQIRFDLSDMTVAALSQIIFDAVRSTCTASVVLSELERIVPKLQVR